MEGSTPSSETKSEILLALHQSAILFHSFPRSGRCHV